jgi:hypothetical protein
MIYVKRNNATHPDTMDWRNMEAKLGWGEKMNLYSSTSTVESTKLL